MSDPSERPLRLFASTGFILLSLARLLPASDAAANGVRKVLLIAGPITGHPKDTHEYERSVILLEHLLNGSPNLKGLRAEARLGWPENPTALDEADAIVIMSDGSDRKETDHPLYALDRWPGLEKALRRGCGLVNIHWTTFHPARFHDRVTEFLGGYFDYETGTGNPKWYSRIEHGTWDVSLPSPDHPIARGVRPFRVKEEFYYRLRFRDGDPRLRPIAAIGAPLLERTVAWAMERADGGRAFGFTGGHYFENWWNADFRRLVLNAIAWAAGADVPAGGVDSDAAEPYRVLILTGHNSPHHDWRATTAALIHAIEQDPRARVEVSEDIEDLSSTRIRDQAALVLNYSNWDRPALSDAAKRGLTSYLEAGGGLTVVHFSNGAWNGTLPERQDTDWEEFRTRIVRRAWMHGDARSGHDAYGPFRVDVAALPHPITTGLAPFDTEDELYFRQEGPLPIEPLVTARSKVTGKDEPLAWAYDYGKGRVFQTLLGHADVSVRRAAALIRRGTAWAAGRAPLGSDPPARALDRALFREGSPWTPEKSRERAGDPKAPRKTGAVLPPNPGLDGGAGGHWGLKDDRDWVDDRVRRMDTGPFWSSSLDTPSGLVAKAVSVRLDGGGACFDTGALSLRVGWTGGFLAMGPARYGLIERPRIDGRVAFRAPPGAGWEGGRLRYRGLHRSGARVAFSYEVGETAVIDALALEPAACGPIFTRSLDVGPGNETLILSLLAVEGGETKIEDLAGLAVARVEKEGTVTAAALRLGPGAGDRARWTVMPSDRGTRVALEVPPRSVALPAEISIWTGPTAKLPAMPAALARRPPPDGPGTLLLPGEALWPERLHARGSVGRRDEPYVIDTIPVPHENPWRALMFLSGHDFFPDGVAAVATVHGDVWLVSGIDERLEDVVWKRFAAGLYQPLGLRIAGGKVHVLGRDRITVLHDRNGDGEADFHESLTNECETSPEGHDYHTCLETDAEGSFYYASPRGLHRVAADGSRHETIATGFRFPNGIGVGPGSVLTVAPQEGEWTPASQICEVKRGGYYGYPGPRPGPDRPSGRDPPLCYIPRHVDNSTGGQVWAPEGWGPLGGQLLALSFGRSSLLLVLRDATGNPPQGAAVPLGLRFLSGAMRGRFHPRDGQLYVTGLLGWVTNAIADGSFQRVRWTGRRIAMPAGFEARANGIVLAFSEPLDRETAEDPGSYAVRRWNYRHSEGYGSEEYSVARPDLTGHDPVKVVSATLLDGGERVFLEIPRLVPAMQMHITVSLVAAGGADVAWDIYPTIHRVGPPLEVDDEETDPETDEAPEPAGPRGLALTITSLASGQEDARVARLAAISVPAGSAPSAFLEPGPFRARWTGRLVLDGRSRIRFGAEGRGHARLEIDGRVVLEGGGDDLARIEGVLARLPRGESNLSLEYTSPESGEAWLRLYWEGRGFARETVPPTAFRRHAASEPAALGRGLALRRALEAAAVKGCRRCHMPVDRSAPPILLGPSPPSFEGIGDRLEERWMALWIGGRAGEKSPSCPAGRTGAGEGPARDLAAYLASHGGEEDAEEPAKVGGEEAERGGRLFARLGCIACHTLPDAAEEEDEHGRVPLRGVALKWKPLGLCRYLESPARHRSGSRMPDFRLSRDEAASLAAFIISRSALRDGGGDGGRGNAASGERLAASLGCLGCHDERAPGGPTLELIERADWRRSGCAAEGGPTGRAPDLGLRAEDREALWTLQAAGHGTLRRECASEASERSILAFRCTACHERDGEPSTWSRVATEVESLAAPEPPAVTVQSRPSLTFTGEQLEEGWLRELLAGRLSYSTRPWLEARMPAFPPEAGAIARGLALAHGMPPLDVSRDAVSPQDAEIGRRLLGAASGFSCVTCHPVGSEPALMTHHFGAINLEHARARLRPEFYLRWMRNPQRIAPLTAMPAYADESGSATPLVEVLGGDAARQFEAVWQYLGTLR